jgi:hypothetical protein
MRSDTDTPRSGQGQEAAIATIAAQPPEKRMSAKASAASLEAGEISDGHSFIDTNAD